MRTPSLRSMAVAALCMGVLSARGGRGSAQAPDSQSSVPLVYLPVGLDLPTLVQIELQYAVEVTRAPSYPHGFPMELVTATTIVDWTQDDVVFVLATRPGTNACHVSVPFAYDWADNTRWELRSGSQPLPHGSYAFCQVLGQLRLEESILLSAALARLQLLLEVETGDHVQW